MGWQGEIENKMTSNEVCILGYSNKVEAQAGH